MYKCHGTVDAFYPNLGIGLMYLLMGIFCQIMYIPCIIVMARPPLFHMPCFKIMIYMGVVDVICLIICADLAGIWQITGQTYCHSPLVSYILGNISMGLWAATCFCCVFLAFNRSWELMVPSKAYIFEGRFMYFWILLPTCYFLFFTFFERPLLYDPRLHAFLFDPRTNISQQLDPHIYSNLPHTINNSIVIVCLLAFYPIICASLAYQMKRNQASRISTMTKQIILQSMVICGCHIVGCFLYVYTQYFPVPSIFTIIGNLAWIGNHGLPGIVYISLNKTIRCRVLALFGIRRTEVNKVVVKPHTLSFGHPLCKI
ncbi:hypothetical protein V3C99_012894 [Haemonchus contortus]